jgi:hypothetical protein
MYIFTAPAKAYDVAFTYEGLQEFIKAGRSGWHRMIGTTLEVSNPYAGRIQIKLYDTIIGEVLSNGNVAVMEAINNHGSQATTWWVQKLLTDNKCGGFVYRDKGKYAVAGKAWVRNI